MRPRTAAASCWRLFQYRQMLTQGEKGFTGEFVHGGVEPFYPPSASARRPTTASRDVRRAAHHQAGVAAKWYFRRSDQDKWYMPQAPTGTLIGVEAPVDHDKDPCEVYLSDYAKQEGGSLPGRMEVRYKDRPSRMLPT